MAQFDPTPEVQPDLATSTYEAALRDIENVADTMPAPEEAPRPATHYVGGLGQRRYVLLFPVTVGDKTFRYVTVSHPALWDVQDWLAGKMQSHFELIARMTGLTTVELGALRWPDVQALLDITQNMLPEFIQQGIAQQPGGTP